MTARPVVLRRIAERDVEGAVDWYREEGGEALALRFVDALETAFARIAQQPSAGSPRYSHELDLPGLRTRQVTGFPYVLFYVEQPTHIEVWRLLHGERDLPAALQGAI